MSKIKVSMLTKTNKKQEKILKDIKDSSVKVGWFEDTQYKNGLYVAEVAYMNENGCQIKRNGKVIGIVPARPFLAITMTDNSDRWQFIWKKLYKQVLDGKMSLQTALKELGKIVKESIENTIWSKVPPPNALSTEKKKGRNQPLIDTGLMLKTINYESKVGK